MYSSKYLIIAQYCQFINNVEIVIIHSINCPFNLLYCAICKSLYNVSVLTHECNVIISQFTIFSSFKYYYYNSPSNHSHKDVNLELIHKLKLLMITRKSTMICSIAQQIFKVYLPCFSLDKFYNGKMELKISHFSMFILANITFILISFLFSRIDLFYFVNSKNIKI